jgi:hypothetical protein
MFAQRFLSAVLVVAASASLGRADEPQYPGPGSVTAESRLAAIGLQPQVPPECAPVAACPAAACPVDCRPSNSCCFDQGRCWASAEFLLWWVKPGRVPPLGTASLGGSGVLGAPGTTTLFGDSLDYGARPGARFTVGSWLNCDCTKGFELSYFFLGGDSTDSSASSSGAAGSVVLGRPFFNVITGRQDVQLVAFPGAVAGNLTVSSDTWLQGAEANLLCNLCCSNPCVPCPPNPCEPACAPASRYRVSLIAGFRFLNLDEDLTITERLTLLPTAPPPFVPGSTITVTDRFETRNWFYGPQVGVRAEWWRGRNFVNVLGKVALGVTHQEVIASGTTTFTTPGGASVTQPGGLLVQATNAGSRSRNRFSVVPEIGINVGRQLTDRLSVFAGYSFLYWSNVVRPGDQIDLGVNPTQLPTPAGPGVLVGPARPAPVFRETSFWAHGLNVGLAVNW